MLTMAIVLTSCSDEDNESAADLSVAAFYPTIVMSGTEVEITGNGLSHTTDVLFPGGFSAQTVKVIDDNRIIATAPANIAEAEDVLTIVTDGDMVKSRQTIRKAHPALRYFNPTDVVKTYRLREMTFCWLSLLRLAKARMQ